MKLKYLFIVVFAVFVACEENEMNSCGTNNPLHDIAWLKELKTNFESDSSLTKRKITQFNYKGKTVFMIEHCVGCPDSTTTVYDCEKNGVCVFGGIAGVNTCPDFDKSATNEKVLWEN